MSQRCWELSSWIFEYQLDSQPLSPCELKRENAIAQGEDYIPQCLDDGRYRNVQCSKDGNICWCVDAKGHEIASSKQSSSTVSCFSSCQLHRQQVFHDVDVSYTPQCSDTGEYEEVQCDSFTKECWCVDADGMEIYGTRQNGKPEHCPGNCEVRNRRLLHGFGEKSPPQCSPDGTFLPVQCKFINTTDMMVFDLLHTFSRFPSLFQTFSNFRRAFPEVSTYCFCVDSQGRELAGTGLELLLDEVYDTVFSGFDLGHSFTESNMYRILQRRFLGVHLAMSGRFRCPTKCEVERSIEARANNTFWPTCNEDGSYKPTKCYGTNLCWCVDHNGKEIVGSRQNGEPFCSLGNTDCLTERRQALSQVFFGPVGFFSQNNILSTPGVTQENPFKLYSFCNPELSELVLKSGLLDALSEFNKPTMKHVLSEVIRGLFPSTKLALKALQLTTNPKRLQENLFGGKFLKNIGQFNFSGAVGSRGTFNFDSIFKQVGVTADSTTFDQVAKLISSDVKPNTLHLEQQVRDEFGKDVNLLTNQNLINIIGSVLENEQFFITLRQLLFSFKAGEEDQLDIFFQLLFQNFDTNACDKKEPLFVPRCSQDGLYEQIQCMGMECWCVDSQGKEIPMSRTQRKKPHCPSACEKEREKAKLSLASQAAGSEIFIPKCEADGSFKSFQCFGKNCFCVDREGMRLTRATSRKTSKCPSACQREAAQHFLRNAKLLLSRPSSLSQISDVYIPQCNADGSWREVQCNGPPEQAFDFYNKWVRENNGSKELLVMNVIETIKRYLMVPDIFTSFKAFVRELYTTGTYKVFSVFSDYATFNNVPSDFFNGTNDALSNNSVFLNPYSFWSLLTGNFTSYPGEYSDFSVPLSHFPLRQCWCVSKNGKMKTGTKTPADGIPKCPGPCSEASQQVAVFLQQAEEIMRVSSTSNVPFSYGFLLASGLQFTSDEIIDRVGTLTSVISLSERLLSDRDYAFQLAAYTTFTFYRKMSYQGDALTYQPYMPQCDGLGYWEPMQCHESTGHCWCVDEEGSYIPGTLVNHPVNVTFCPSWCSLLKKQSLNMEVGTGFIPECQDSDGSFSTVQCEKDRQTCWCVFQNGEEVPDTRTQGREPSCKRPLCSLPFNESGLHNGIVLCEENDQEKQECHLACRQGYHNVLSEDTYQCNVTSRSWVLKMPHPYACQRQQMRQTFHVSANVQVQLPKEKTCNTEISTLKFSLLDHMHANGFCHLQINSFGRHETISICDNSTVTLECSGADQLAMMITWRAQRRNIPINFLPDLHDIENVFNSGNLAERLVTFLKNNAHLLFLGSESILVDVTVSNTSAVQLGCLPGYKMILGVKGCAICPAGTFFSGDACLTCPLGSYQDKEGHVSCNKCTAGRITVFTGSFKATHCVTSCLANNLGLQCNDKGEYKASQKDINSQKWFCVQDNGEKLEWTESIMAYTETQCQELRKFEDLSPRQWTLNAEDSSILFSKSSNDNIRFLLPQCISECTHNYSCGYVAVFSDGPTAICDLYVSDGNNVKCTATEKGNGFLGNAGVESYQSLSCTVKVKSKMREDLAVYRKKGHEFTTGTQKIFQRTNFRKAASGVYQVVAFVVELSALSDVHHFCQAACTEDTCCDGFILNQNVLNGATIMCGLLSYPEALLCSDQDFNQSAGSNLCGREIKYNKEKKEFVFSLGEQNFTITDALLPAASKNDTNYQANLISFQRVYMWKDSNMNVRSSTAANCMNIMLQNRETLKIPENVREAFITTDSSIFHVDPQLKVSSQEFWIFKHEYSSPELAQLWCLTRCEEEDFCKLVDLQDSDPSYFTCTLYPDTQVCGSYSKSSRESCRPVLPSQPQTTYKKKLSLKGSVKNFYSRLPFKKLVAYSVRRRINQTGKTLSEGFFECERHCDEDSCCKGFGFIKDLQTSAKEVLCLILNSIGVQTCPESEQSSWRALPCEVSNIESEIYPFGWYQKPVNQWNNIASMCPPFTLPSPSINVTGFTWKRLETSSILIDPNLSHFDIIHISKDLVDNLTTVKEWCLSACTSSPSCVTISLDMKQPAFHCVLYPQTQVCIPNSRFQLECKSLLKEPSEEVYYRTVLDPPLTSVTITSHGTLIGRSKMVPVGSNWKTVGQFLGIPYAEPPTGVNRFTGPQPPKWRGIWNASFIRPSCLQPGDQKDQLLTSDEDCLYLNVFMPSNTVRNSSVLVFFHNPARELNGGDNLIDGSYLAALGNIIVVTANFRIGVFGFLTTASTQANGNFGLQDQIGVLKWVQKNIASFGGDPGSVTLASDRSGADIAGLHLTSVMSTNLFQRVLLMGGSPFSPNAVISLNQAEERAVTLGKEVGCFTSSSKELVSCLKDVAAVQLNEAQTKLLAVSSPFQAWGPTVDGINVREPSSVAFQNGRFQKVDLMIGTSSEDGLISRAKKIKKFEELQGRVNSKTAFYAALTNALGGENNNTFVHEAATWFYSMAHSVTPAGYSLFSRALENATRDYFILCPTIQMAKFWAEKTRANVFMYHVPESVSQTSIDIPVTLDLQLAFGLPHSPQTRHLFNAMERRLSLQMMLYTLNFIKSGNPNYPYTFSKRSFSNFLPAWPAFVPHPNGDNFKVLDDSLNNGKGLRKAECSFWADYIQTLTTSTSRLFKTGPDVDVDDINPNPSSNFQTPITKKKGDLEKDAYN
ncbi:thyroglobulin [Erpetoichthys calabaricus]|uniref:thyroglobulin n=1 Tax=Erpetoichthys calabaricus TaxID=27687 RepID=UPI0022348CE1|nr:thyroglobulin [Erpetoichthys calabaricus]